MKQTTTITMALLLFFSITVSAQITKQALKNAPQKEKTFFDIQKSFNDYWAPYHVNNGYYIENGVKKKAPGWKQFKRWEYYWEPRVNPTTGAFPKASAADIYLQLKSRRTGRSSNGNWTSLGPSSSAGGYEGIGRINCVAFRSGDNNTYYAGTPSGGLWKTTDNGGSWTVLTDDNAVLGVSDAVVAAGVTTATDTIYIATGDRDGGSMWSLGSGNYNDNNSIGVLKSVDGGTTWSTTGLSFNASDKKSIYRLLMDPGNHNTLYAATSDGLYKTTDGGTSWSLISAYLLRDIEFNPGNTSIMYGGHSIGYIYRSTDGGVNWSTVINEYSNNGRRVNLAVTAADATVVYAIMSWSNGGLYGIYKSTDSGATYSKVYDGTVAGNNLLDWKTDGSGSGGQGGYDLTIAVDPTNANTVYVGGVNSHKSTDGGATWTAVNCWTSSSTYNKNGAPVVHADKHMMKFRSSDNTLFETNDGGIYYTTDGGANWSDKTNGMVPSQMYRLGVAATSSSEVITGLQDNATKLLSGGSWSMVNGGDGMECLIDYSDINTQYATTPNGNLRRTTDHWSNSTNISVGTETGYWVTPYTIDPSNNQTLYLGLENVWKTTDQGNNWTKISTMSTASKLRAVVVAPSNSQVIYTSDPDQVWVTTNGGTSWAEITGTLPVSSSSITYISVKNDDPNTAWVSMGEYNSYSVFQTTDGGSSWTNISAGLPQIPVMCVIQNTQNSSQTELYAGTDVGVYVKVGTANWQAFNSGLPNVVVNELEIYYNSASPSQSRLRAATSGRGLWESELYSPPNAPPVADFSADIRIPQTSQTVTFSDLSTNAPTSWHWSFTPSTITWQNGTSATSQNPEVQFTSTGNYSAKLVVSNSYGSDSIIKSSFIRVDDYCAASGNGNRYIDDIETGSISNSGTGDDYYSDYNYLSTQMKVGTAYNVSIHSVNAYYHDTISCWVDWNQDGDFTDNNELSFVIAVEYYTEQRSITPPAEAALGFTRMRIRYKEGSSAVQSCGTSTYGEVEDYAIEVMPEENVWTGTTSQWNSESNWSKSVIPTSSYNVTIPSSPSGGNYPTIPAGYTANCNKLTLQGNATITVNGTLNVEQQ